MIKFLLTRTGIYGALDEVVGVMRLSYAFGDYGRCKQVDLNGSFLIVKGNVTHGCDGR